MGPLELRPHAAVSVVKANERTPMGASSTGIAETLGPILPPEIIRAAAALLEKASAAKLSIATAESCTGGMLSALLTDIEGESHAFERGFVAYSDRAKCELLGIADAIIERCGAVSREVAEAMAASALTQSGADVTMAITGFAGPGAPDEEPGLVHFACTRLGYPVAHEEHHFGDIGRGPTRIACLAVAIAMLDRAIGG